MLMLNMFEMVNFLAQHMELKYCNSFRSDCPASVPAPTVWLQHFTGRPYKNINWVLTLFCLKSSNEFFSSQARLNTQVLTLQGPVWSSHLYLSDAPPIPPLLVHSAHVLTAHRPGVFLPQGLGACCFPCLDHCTPDTYMAGSLSSFRSFLSKVTFMQWDLPWPSGLQSQPESNC